VSSLRGLIGRTRREGILRSTDQLPEETCRSHGAARLCSAARPPPAMGVQRRFEAPEFLARKRAPRDPQPAALYGIAYFKAWVIYPDGVIRVYLGPDIRPPSGPPGVIFYASSPKSRKPKSGPLSQRMQPGSRRLYLVRNSPAQPPDGMGKRSGLDPPSEALYIRSERPVFWTTTQPDP